MERWLILALVVVLAGCSGNVYRVKTEQGEILHCYGKLHAPQK